MSFSHTFQVKAINKHYAKQGVYATMPMDYLCLGSGHNDLSKMLAHYLLLKFNYEIDVVCISFFIKQFLEYSYEK